MVFLAVLTVWYFLFFILLYNKKMYLYLTIITDL